MAGRGKQGAQSKYDHLIKLLLIGDSGGCGVGTWGERPGRAHGESTTAGVGPINRSIDGLTKLTQNLYDWMKPGVGKSCLLLRYSDDSFTPSFITTIGCVKAV
jgi:hypothetical protein